MTDSELQARIAKLRHLFAEDDKLDDFVMPTALKEVPSLTLTETMPLNGGGADGQLWRHSERNSD